MYTNKPSPLPLLQDLLSFVDVSVLLPRMVLLTSAEWLVVMQQDELSWRCRLDLLEYLVQVVTMVTKSDTQEIVFEEIKPTDKIRTYVQITKNVLKKYFLWTANRKIVRKIEGFQIEFKMS